MVLSGFRRHDASKMSSISIICRYGFSESSLAFTGPDFFPLPAVGPPTNGDLEERVLIILEGEEVWLRPGENVLLSVL